MKQSSNIMKYSPLKIQQFKMWLQEMKEKGETKFFEVYVDDFKVVPKTENPDDFDNHEQYIDESTEKVSVLYYNTPKSNHYKQNIYLLKEKQENQTLSGVEVQQKIDEGINRGLKGVEERLACEQLKKDLSDTQKKLEESESYAEKLESRIETLKENLENAKNAKEILSIVAEYGAEFLGKKKPNSALAGAQTEKKPEEQASFKMKSSEGENSVSEQEKYFIEFGKSLRENFSREEFEKILSVIDAFAKDKSNIEPVVSLLNINTNKQTQNENGKV